MYICIYILSDYVILYYIILYHIYIYIHIKFHLFEMFENHFFNMFTYTDLYTESHKAPKITIHDYKTHPIHQTVFSFSLNVNILKHWAFIVNRVVEPI